MNYYKHLLYTFNFKLNFTNHFIKNIKSNEVRKCMTVLTLKLI